MNFKLPQTLVAFLSLLIISSCSETKDKVKLPSEPELTEHYYFEGKLDNKPFLIEKKYYKEYFDEKPFLIDFGGTLINCANEPENDIHSNCYTYYSCGILVDKYSFPEEVKKHNSAKMYFGPIDVDKRIFTNELTELKKFFQNNKLRFRRDFRDIENQGGFSFDFFPINPDKDNLFYYSTRFNDNSEYTANITSVEEIDDYYFVIEGTVDNCKLYDSREDIDENQAYIMLTDFKFRVKIAGDFNYNNYKNE